MVRLIHAADFHLDSPFSGLTPEMAARRRGEQRQLLSRLAALARERQADAVLLSGDLLDTGRAFRETVEALSGALGETGCPVFIAPGNHDFYESRSPYAAFSWPDNVHIFSTPEPEAVELPGKACAVWGAAFPAAHLERSPLAGFHARSDGKVHIMVLHGEPEGGRSYGPVLKADIAQSGLDYLALGHVHQYGGLQKEGSTFWAYPGCPEGRGFDELGQKGVVYLEVDKGICRAEFVPLCRRKYEILTVDLTGRDDPRSAVLAGLPQGAEQDIYRVLLTGERTGALDLEALERELAPRFYALTLRDNTRPAREAWSRLEEDTLTGLFLREMDRLCRAEPENQVYQMAVRFGLAALEGGEVPFS